MATTPTPTLTLTPPSRPAATGRRSWALAPAVAALVVPGLRALAQPSATVDFSGVSISSLTASPADVVRTSAGTISAAPGYLFEFNPTVRGTGFLGVLLIPNPTPLGDVLNSFLTGSQRVLRGAVRNPGSAVPTQMDREVLAGTFSGLTVSLTFDQRLLADRHVEAGILNIQKPVGFGLRIDSGGGAYTVFDPPAARASEFHFGGDLRSVLETGLAADSGPAKVRFLDDAAFGPILGGPGHETEYPSPPTPQGVTAAQSAFGTPASFGVPPVGPGATGEELIYRVSPPRNLADPADRAKSRGLGLALFPNSRDAWPDDRLGQWTLVWDLYIPASTWNSPTAGEFLCPLIEDNHNNDQSADMFIRKVGGQAVIGYQAEFGAYTPAPQVGPDRWFRLALVSDGYRRKQGRLFVDGQFIGTTGGDWVYASTKSADPRYGDISSGNPAGTVVPAGVWAGWGRFPSPWALSPNAAAAPMASTVCLFSDLQGRGETVYVGHLFFTDEALADADVAALGGPNGRGIRYLRPAACGADFNGDGFLDFFDYDDFVRCFESGDCPAGATADFNGDGFADFFDYDDFVGAFQAGC